MRRYYMSIIDFSEIENITANEELKEQLKDDLKKYGLLTEKGNPSNAQITQLVEQVAERFFFKLSRRIFTKNGGIEGVYNTFRLLEQKKDYAGMYFYLAFLYGFFGWRVPRKVCQLSSNDEALKVFFTEFCSRFEEYLQKSKDSDLGDK